MHSLILTTAGLFGCGSSRSSQLTFERAVTPVPTLIPLKLSVASVACGSHHSLLVLTDGTVYCFGWNEGGQCGQRLAKTVVKPKQVKGLTDVIKAAGGEMHSLALTRTGIVFSWGTNSAGELGRKVAALVGGSTPGRVDAIQRPCVDIDCSMSASLAVDVTGLVWVWGSLMGEGMASHAPMPRGLMNGAQGIVAASIGKTHVAALDSPSINALRTVLSEVCRGRMDNSKAKLVTPWRTRTPFLLAHAQNQVHLALAEDVSQPLCE